MLTLTQFKHRTSNFLKRCNRHYQHGYVKFYQNKAYCWSALLETGKDVPGVIAYSLSSGQTFIASGGNDVDGCECWKEHYIN